MKQDRLPILALIGFSAFIMILGCIQFAQMIQWLYLNVEITVK